MIKEVNYTNINWYYVTACHDQTTTQRKIRITGTSKLEGYMLTQETLVRVKTEIKIRDTNWNAGHPWRDHITN